MGVKHVQDYKEEDSKRDEIEDEDKEGSIVFKGSCEIYNASLDTLRDEDLAELPPSQED